jgi:hypothetical protein
VDIRKRLGLASQDPWAELRAPRDKHPNAEAAKLAIDALQKVLSTQLDAMQWIEQKSAAIVTAVLGLGILNSDHLTASLSGVAAWIRLAGIVVSGFAVGFALLTLWSRTLYAGPRAIETARATGSEPLQMTQSLVDVLAASVHGNEGAMQAKGRCLNLELVSAVIAVLAIVALDSGVWAR